MPEYALLGTMDNKSSPLLVPGFVQTLCLNGEMTELGHFKKRREIGTAVTVGNTFGSSAPYRIFRWTDAAGLSVLIAAGSDVVAFVNPVNGYLYIHGTGYTSGAIFDDTTSVPGSRFDSNGWGLVTPGATLPTTDRTTASSRMLGGGYAYVLTAYNDVRRVESLPCVVLVSATGAPENGDQLQWCSGPPQQVTFAAYNPSSPDTDWTHIRTYRVRLMTFPKSSSGWFALPADPLQLSGLRLIREVAASFPLTLVADAGGQPLGPLLTHAGTPIPASMVAAERFDGRTFYAKGSTVYFSNPDCPETYAANVSNYPATGDKTTPILGTTEGGLVQGEGIVDLPPDMGPIVGFAASEDTLLALCQTGAWRMLRLRDGITYGYAKQPLTLGCVSRATIASSPYGVWWLSEEGVVLWDGRHLPALVTKDVLDIGNSDTAFASDLSEACAAFHHRRQQYICAVPKSPSGQFLLCIQADKPLQRGVAYSVWTLNLASAISGMGYDFSVGEVIYKSGANFYKATASPTYDENSLTYSFRLKGWIVDNSGRPVAANPLVRIKTLRDYVAGAQTLTLNVRGAPMPDESAGVNRSKALTLAANTRLNEGGLIGVSGEAMFIDIENDDSEPLTLLAVTLENSAAEGKTERAND